jgi:hypothetical protein
MAIDPNISLQVRPPAAVNAFEPIEQAQEMQARTMQMRNAMLENQQRQLQFQQQTEDYQDQQKIRNLWSTSANGDLDQLLENAKKAGVGPRTIFPLQQNILNWKKEHAALDKATLDNNASRNDLLHAIFNPAFDETDPTKQQQLFEQGKQTAVSRGIIKPEVAAGMIYPGPDGMKTLKSSFLTEKWLTADAQQQRAAAATQQAGTAATRLDIEKPGLITKSAQERRNLAIDELQGLLDPKTGLLQSQEGYKNWAQRYKDINPPPPPVPNQLYINSLIGSKVTPFEREQLAGQAAGRAQTATHQTVMEKQGEQRIGLEGQRVGQAGATTMAVPDGQGNYRLTRIMPGQPVPAGSVSPTGINAQIPGLGPGQTGAGGTGGQQLTGEDYLATLPSATAAQIRSIAEGRDKMPSATSRQPAAITLRNAVYQFDPTFNEERAQMRRAFATGADGRNIGNLNTAVVHLDSLMDAAAAMKNGSFTPGNQAYNAFASIFGSTPPTNFAALKQVVAGEMANALKGQATDPEIAHISAVLNGANSEDQLAGVIRNTFIPALGAKLNTYHERAQQYNVGNWNPVLPTARRVFGKYGMDPTAGPGTQPRGVSQQPPQGMVAVPLKSGRTAYMPPDQAAKFRQDHPQLVK